MALLTATDRGGTLRVAVLALRVAAFLWALLAWSQLSHVAQHWRHGAVGGFFVIAAALSTLAGIAAHRRQRSAVILAVLVVITLAAAQLWLSEPWFVVIGPGLIVGGIPAALLLGSKRALR